MTLRIKIAPCFNLAAVSSSIKNEIFIIGGRKIDQKRLRKVFILETATDSLKDVETFNKEKIGPDHYPCTLIQGGMAVTADV